MNMIKTHDLTPMDEAYKLLTGDPSIKAVSQAAKGQVPLSDKEQRMKDGMEDDGDGADAEDQHEDAVEHPMKMDDKCCDINDAYAMLFESLSVIIKSKPSSV